jgi:hypothetical protein
LLLRRVFIRLAAFAGAESAATAAATSAKAHVFPPRAERQEGRQQMPVVSTAKTN